MFITQIEIIILYSFSSLFFPYTLELNSLHFITYISAIITPKLHSLILYDMIE